MVFNGDGVTPCYVRYAGGSASGVHMVGPTNEVSMPNNTLHFSVAGLGSGGTLLDQAAWLLDWNNLFDWQPLMRGSNGAAASQSTGDDFFWQVAPSTDTTGCHLPGSNYIYGRFVNTCSVTFGKGPYYGTPAGQAVPYTVFLASTISQGVYSSPFASNCSGSCSTNFHQYSPEYVELPVFIEPSP